MKLHNADLLSGEYYVNVYNYTHAGTNPDELIDGVHYKTIKCKIKELWLDKNKEGLLTCDAVLEPITDLPDWYDYEDYMSDFEVPICGLSDNDFWLTLDWDIFE